MFISSKDLYEILNEKDLLVIDARSFKEYSHGHIPGAVNLDLFSFHWIDSSKEGIEAFTRQTKKIFSMAGIDEKKKVVFYDDISGMLAARGVWLLMYLSHPQGLMLDGGLTKWKNENFPVETKINQFSPSKFEGRPNPDLIVGYEEILANIKTLKIIDARSPEEYSGKLIRAAKSGHIPTSVNIDWNLNINTDGTVKSDKELEGLYTIPKDTKIVTYCQGAYRAANSFLALKKIGFKNVRVYLGSWGEWGNKLELPVD